MCYTFIAGWRSVVARRAHNPKVVGSSPTPATFYKKINTLFKYLIDFKSI